MFGGEPEMGTKTRRVLEVDSKVDWLRTSERERKLSIVSWSNVEYSFLQSLKRRFVGGRVFFVTALANETTPIDNLLFNYTL